jgi:hypothetical protein
VKRLLPVLLLVGGCGRDQEPDVAPVSRDASWAQWAQNPRHTGQAAAAGQPPDRVLADIVLDPFVAPEQADGGGSLHVHYPAPLLAGDDVFLASKTGTFSGRDNWNTQVWNVSRYRWESGTLTQKWTFASDWKPEPDGGALGGWEPVFHPALVGERLYVPGLGGTVHVLDAASGVRLAQTNPFGSSLDPTTYVAGPLTADSAGTVYYNALKLDPGSPWFRDALGAWLVRVTRDGVPRAISFADLIPPPPPAESLCPTTFDEQSLPWPPSPDAAAPSIACGLQRPGLNIAPAIGPNGVLYTVTRAHFSDQAAYLVAVNPDLTLRWAVSLRDRFEDGCGVPVSAGGVLPPNGEPGGCRAGAPLGVDPATNRRGSGRVLDQSTSSPVVAPDGNVFYGAYSRYNSARGHLMKFAPDGRYLGAYAFGWDVTPAVVSRPDGYALVVKDNLYEGVGTYCNEAAFCPPSPGGPFRITAIRGDSLAPLWSYTNTNTESCRRNADGSLSCVSDRPHSFEWCINAPAVDQAGAVYANSEDGNLYVIEPDGSLRRRVFLRLSLGAAYTPMALDSAGRIHTQNAGHLIVMGR